MRQLQSALNDNNIWQHNKTFTKGHHILWWFSILSSQGTFCDGRYMTSSMTPASDTNFAACTGSCGLLFPLAIEMRILTPPSDLLILSSIIPWVQGLGFPLFPTMVLHSFHTFRLSEKLHGYQIASVNWLIDICKVILTLANFIVLWVVGDGSLLRGLLFGRAIII